MQMIIIKSDKLYYAEIISLLKEKKNNVIEIEQYDSPTELVSNILKITKDICIDTIMSIGYQPNLSLAAGALSIKYIVWETEGYNALLFDSSITNRWNWVFVADYRLYKRMEKVGVEHCFFLPIGASGYLQNDKKIDVTIETDSFVLWSSAIYDDLSVKDALVATKDSTKGYIDGITEVHKNYFDDVSIYNTIPKAICEDIEVCYPANLQHFETKADYYNHHLFGPVMDRTNAYPYFAKLDINNIIESIYVVADRKYVFNENFHKGILTSEVEEGQYYMVNDKINIYIPTFDNRNIVSYDVWNMISLGIPVFLPSCMIKGLEDSLKVKTFKKTYDVELIIRECFGNPNKLSQYVKELQRYVNNECRLSDRVDEMIGIIASL